MIGTFIEIEWNHVAVTVDGPLGPTDVYCTHLAYRFDESGGRTVERDFNFDGQEFTAGLGVDTSIKVDTYILDVVYSVYRSDKFDFLVGGGIHAFDLDVSLKARAFIDDDSRRAEAAGSELLAPLPNLRMQAYYKLPGNWAAGVALGWLSANYEDYEGSFMYAHPRVGFRFTDRWMLTAGYQLVDIDLTYERSKNRETEYNIQLSGPTVMK